MAKSYTYWVIMSGDTPTAFRSKDRETLVPTLTQLQRTQSDVKLMWFQANRLWESEEQAEQDAAHGFGPRRIKTWRPGGLHKDPKERFELTRDQKRAKFKKQLGFKSREAATGAEAPRQDKPTAKRTFTRPKTGGITRSTTRGSKPK